MGTVHTVVEDDHGSSNIAAGRRRAQPVIISMYRVWNLEGPKVSTVHKARPSEMARQPGPVVPNCEWMVLRASRSGSQSELGLLEASYGRPEKI